MRLVVFPSETSLLLSWEIRYWLDVSLLESLLLLTLLCWSHLVTRAFNLKVLLALWYLVLTLFPLPDKSPLLRCLFALDLLWIGQGWLPLHYVVVRLINLIWEWLQSKVLSQHADFNTHPLIVSPEYFVLLKCMLLTLSVFLLSLSYLVPQSVDFRLDLSFELSVLLCLLKQSVLQVLSFQLTCSQIVLNLVSFLSLLPRQVYYLLLQVLLACSEWLNLLLKALIVKV